MSDIVTQFVVAAARSQWWRFISPIMVHCFGVVKLYDPSCDVVSRNESLFLTELS